MNCPLVLHDYLVLRRLLFGAGASTSGLSVERMKSENFFARSMMFSDVFPDCNIDTDIFRALYLANSSLLKLMVSFSFAVAYKPG